VKAWLSREGVPFTAHNIDEDPHAYDDLLARGFLSVPVTVFGLSSRSRDAFGEAKVDDRAVTGFDPEALAAALADWRDRGRGGS
jgi:hypothetical protein